MAYYLQIDFTKVKGYDKLTEPAKNLFRDTYRRHNEAQGADYKSGWIPVKVQEFKTHLIVNFANGKWQHYAANGTWY